MILVEIEDPIWAVTGIGCKRQPVGSMGGTGSGIDLLPTVHCSVGRCWIGHVPICTFVRKAIYVFSGISLDVSLKNHKGREHHMDETISWTDLVSRRFLNHIFA